MCVFVQHLVNHMQNVTSDQRRNTAHPTKKERGARTFDGFFLSQALYLLKQQTEKARQFTKASIELPSYAADRSLR